MNDLSVRLSLIKPSPTLAVTQRALELRAQGIDVISLSAGEPDFDTPDHIIEAAKKSLDDGMTRYTPVAGIPPLRAAIARETERSTGVSCSNERVIVTVGAKHALYGFFQAVIDPGDEVLVPAPYWVSYPDQVLLAGGTPKIVETRAEDGWMITPEALRKAVTPRSKAVVINTPGNPTGGVYTAERLAQVTEAALALGLWIVSDEIYRDLVYDGHTHTSVLSLVPESKRDRIFVVDGVSKTYAMTGWRIGWGIGSEALVRAVATIQGQSTSNPTAVAQAAALAALDGPRDFISQWRTTYAKRRDTMVHGLSKIPGVSCATPKGAFYVLPCVTGLLEKMGDQATDVSLCTYLLEKARVAAVPGSGFGAPGHIRLSYASATKTIEKGLDRMTKAVLSV
jgi:aspartate aminotransferase